MSKAKKITLFTLSLLCLVAIAILGVENLKFVTPLAFLTYQTDQVPTGVVAFASAFLGGLAIFFKLWDINLTLHSDIKQFEHRKEKAEVKAQTNSDQVKALEAKIQTLEKALEKALSSSQSKSGS